MDYALSPAELATGIHPRQLDVSFSTGGAVACATLNVPQGARGSVVLFADAGASRFDPGPRFIAEVLEQSGFATLSLDPLSPCTEEEVAGVVAWLRRESFTAALAIGLLASPDSAEAVRRAATTLQLPSALAAEREPAKAAELAAELFSRQLTG